MKTSTKGILVTLFLAACGGYGWGWTIRPQVTYQMQYPPLGAPAVPYYWDQYNPNILQIFVTVDNEGGTPIVTDITVSAINATISNSQNGLFAPTSTERLLIHAKNSFSTTFYVMPFGNTTSFRLFISNVQTVYGPDPLSTLIYFIYAPSTYSSVNLVSLTYVRTSQSSNAYNPQP
jgi:hypothetical protein